MISINGIKKLLSLLAMLGIAGCASQSLPYQDPVSGPTASLTIHLDIVSGYAQFNIDPNPSMSPAFDKQLLLLLHKEWTSGDQQKQIKLPGNELASFFYFGIEGNSTCKFLVQFVPDAGADYVMVTGDFRPVPSPDPLLSLQGQPLQPWGRCFVQVSQHLPDGSWKPVHVTRKFFFP